MTKINQIGAIIRNARSAQNMTQEQLANKCGINKTGIAKAENDAGQVSVYVIRTIIEKGLGGQFGIELKF